MTITIASFAKSNSNGDKWFALTILASQDSGCTKFVCKKKTEKCLPFKRLFQKKTKREEKLCIRMMKQKMKCLLKNDHSLLEEYLFFALCLWS